MIENHTRADTAQGGRVPDILGAFDSKPSNRLQGYHMHPNNGGKRKATAPSHEHDPKLIELLYDYAASWRGFARVSVCPQCHWPHLQYLMRVDGLLQVRVPASGMCLTCESGRNDLVMCMDCGVKIEGGHKNRRQRCEPCKAKVRKKRKAEKTMPVIDGISCMYCKAPIPDARSRKRKTCSKCQALRKSVGGSNWRARIRSARLNELAESNPA